MPMKQYPGSSKKKKKNFRHAQREREREEMKGSYYIIVSGQIL